MNLTSTALVLLLTSPHPRIPRRPPPPFDTAENTSNNTNRCPRPSVDHEASREQWDMRAWWETFRMILRWSLHRANDASALSFARKASPEESRMLERRCYGASAPPSDSAKLRAYSNFHVSHDSSLSLISFTHLSLTYYFEFGPAASFSIVLIGST
ncbi:hypothetical protein BDV98DRAFT_402351 [Pterulicium gracile]|uniref:Uncharacterized protein n=1 Tax=Pterulicium gracile TaxID=1884261 RepID=A0A5C3PZQ6_9AGAR|nr:hypothetical protein BDV98DRAFT_402351 [Pterula gracilis]